MQIDEELLNDFKTCLSKINFKSYNPMSADFNKALNVGLMYNLLQTMNTIVLTSNTENTEYKDIKEEISGAEHYYNLYDKTKDASYKEMAQDEIKHANILINKEMQTSNENQKRHLAELQKEVNDLIIGRK